MYRFLLVVFSFIVLPALAAEHDPTTDPSGQKRVALVIGNVNYDQIDDQLSNPGNDAKAIAASLRELDIEVIEAIDLDYRTMREMLRKFDRALQDADAGLFFYAGHGMEYRGRNYILPTDAILETEGDVGLGLIDIGQVLQVMETSVPTRLVFLDACRNNPLARSFRQTLGSNRSATVGRGLGRIDASVGTFIAYATAPGEIAADGNGDHSPFTTALLEHIDEPGLDVSQFMHKVRNSVIEATNERQIPWESSSLRGPFVLNQDAFNKPSPAISNNKADIYRAETVFWESIRDTSRLSSFEAYIERFGEDGVFAPLARAQIEILRIEQSKVIETALDFDRKVLQQSLAGLGYPVGHADGIFGQRTRLSIRKWQEDNKVDATGYLTADQAEYLASSEPAKHVATSEQPTTDQSTGHGEEVQTASIALDSSPRDTKRHQVTKDSSTRDSSTRVFKKNSGKNILNEYLTNTNVADFEARAQQGDLMASTIAGLAYEMGQGVEKDYTKARPFHQKSCDGSVARSCNSLGTLYYKGLGVKRDYSKAHTLYKKACDDGYGHSCHNLGTLYYNGFGVQRDYAKAQQLYRDACDEDIARSCNNLGSLYFNGFGVEQDYAKARTLYQKSCDDGYVQSCNNLGTLYHYGFGVQQDFAKAKSLYQKSCEGGIVQSCNNLGPLYYKGFIDSNVSAQNEQGQSSPVDHQSSKL